MRCCTNTTSSFWDSDPHVKWGSLSESHVRIPANGSQAKTPAIEKGEGPGYRKSGEDPGPWGPASVSYSVHNSVVDRELSLQLHFFVAKKCRLAGDLRHFLFWYLSVRKNNNEN